MAGDSLQALQMGTTLPGGLRVQRVIGTGTFGHVYECSSPDGAPVAVREYLPRGVAGRGTDGIVGPLSTATRAAFDMGRQQFVQRAERMLAVRHPNVAAVHRVFEENGTAYAAMDLARGRSLASLIEERGTLSAAQFAASLAPVADGLATMHDAGIAHGNIGPGSVIVNEVGTPVLIGLTAPPRDQFGTVAKPGYAPIEHYSADARFADVRGDVYALAAVAYRCLTGVTPPEPPLRVERETMVPAARAARGRYPAQLLAAVDAALAILPDDRPAAIDELHAALRGPGDNATVADLPAPGAPKAPSARQANAGRRPVLVVAAVLVAAVVGGVALWQVDMPDDPSPPLATDPAPPSQLPSTGPEPPAPPDRVDGPVDAPLEIAVEAPAPEDTATDPASPAPDLSTVAPEPARLAVDTTPTGVEVLLNGASAGYAPVELDGLDPGVAVVVLRHPGYRTVTLGDVALQPGETTELRPVLARATGSLRVTAVPAAWIDVAGERRADTTPATLTDLPAGPVTLTLGAEDHATLDVHVDVPDDDTADVDFVLERTFGRLTLDVTPTDAAVELPDAAVAYTPGVRIPVGAQRVRIDAAGFDAVERVVDIDGDVRLEVTLAATASPFTVAVRPPDSTVRLDGADMAYTAGMMLAPGAYRVAATRRGYAPWRGTLNHGTTPSIHAVALEFVSAEYADPLQSGGAGPEMAVVPAGSFRMGCSGAGCAAREQPSRTVVFERPFAVAKYETTFVQFDRFVRATGRQSPDDADWGRGRRPVINVSWEDARAYAAWLSAETGRRYALPTEAEWEYAARAGTRTPYPWGQEAGIAGNCSDCGDAPGRTVAVGSFEANAWGLFDMHGNVWEWVEDCANGSYEDAPRDGTAWLAGDCSRRMLRGGSWFNPGVFARSAARLDGAAVVRGNIAGFRVTARDD